MVVRKNGAAHNGKIGIGTQHIMRKLFYKVKLLDKSGAVYAHRNVLCRKGDAMFIIINIGRILQKPLLPCYRNGNEAQVLSCGLCKATHKALILAANGAFGIRVCFSMLSGGNCAGVFFGLGEIDGYIQFSVFSTVNPFYILFYAVGANIIGCAGNMIIIIGCFLGRLFVELFKFALYFTRSRS